MSADFSTVFEIFSVSVCGWLLEERRAEACAALFGKT